MFYTETFMNMKISLTEKMFYSEIYSALRLTISLGLQVTASLPTSLATTSSQTHIVPAISIDDLRIWIKWGTVRPGINIVHGRGQSAADSDVLMLQF